jgi:hypothetical protein
VIHLETMFKDEPYLRGMAGSLGLAELLQRALAEAGTAA